jgi:hypothetical protein
MYCNPQSKKVLEDTKSIGTPNQLKKLSHTPQSDVLFYISFAELWPTNRLNLTLGIHNITPIKPTNI